MKPEHEELARRLDAMTDGPLPREAARTIRGLSRDLQRHEDGVPRETLMRTIERLSRDLEEVRRTTGNLPESFKAVVDQRDALERDLEEARGERDDWKARYEATWAIREGNDARKARIEVLEALIREMVRPVLPSVREHDEWCLRASRALSPQTTEAPARERPCGYSKREGKFCVIVVGHSGKCMTGKGVEFEPEADPLAPERKP